MTVKKVEFFASEKMDAARNMFKALRKRSDSDSSKSNDAPTPAGHAQPHLSTAAKAPERVATVVFTFHSDLVVSDRALAPSRERPAPSTSILKQPQGASPRMKAELFDGTPMTVPKGHIFLPQYEGAGGMMVAPENQKRLARVAENDRFIRTAFGTSGGGTLMLQWIGREQGLGNYQAREAALTMRQQKSNQDSFFRLPNYRLYSLPPNLAKLPFTGAQLGADLSHNNIEHLPGSLFASPLLDKVEFDGEVLYFLGKNDEKTGDERMLGSLSLFGNPIAALLMAMPKVTSAQEAGDVHEFVERFGLGIFDDGHGQIRDVEVDEVRKLTAGARKLDAEGVDTGVWQHPRS